MGLRCARILCVWMMVVVGLMLASDVVAGERSLVRGRQLYEKYCAACHGPQGRGDGTMTVDPPVADLTSSEVLRKPDSRLLQSIHAGRPNTAMDAWKSVMSEDATRDVLAYVLTFPR